MLPVLSGNIVGAVFFCGVHCTPTRFFLSLTFLMPVINLAYIVFAGPLVNALYSIGETYRGFAAGNSRSLLDEYVCGDIVQMRRHSSSTYRTTRFRSVGLADCLRTTKHYVALSVIVYCMAMLHSCLFVRLQ